MRKFGGGGGGPWGGGRIVGGRGAPSRAGGVDSGHPQICQVGVRDPAQKFSNILNTLINFKESPGLRGGGGIVVVVENTVTKFT